MDLPKFLREQPEGILLSIKVQPRASANEIGEPLGDELKVKVTAPPVDDAANEALIRFLSDVLGIPRNRISLMRGHTSRHKTIQVRGIAATEVARTLRR